MKKRYLLIGTGIFIIVCTCGMIIYNDDWYNPVTSILVSAIISFIFYLAGKEQPYIDSVKIEKDINQKWMPQAISSINKLITLRANIKSLKKSNNEKCNKVETFFPDIEKTKNSTVKIFLSTDCENISQRLDDIDNQIDDAIDDWNRFAQSNCFIEDCDTIQKSIKSMEEKRLLN